MRRKPITRATRFLSRLRDYIPRKRAFQLFGEMSTPHEVTALTYTYPFRHAIIDNFLPEAAYADLTSKVAAVLERGLSERRRPDAFSRFELYDLYSYTPQPTCAAPYGYFFAESYIQMVETVLRQALSRDVYWTFHHHGVSEQDNYIHNDYIYGLFGEERLPNGVNVFRAPKEDTKNSRHSMVRAAAAIYYLNNEPWEPPLGGETGIFAGPGSDTFVRAVPPVNNRLLLFEITPYSFHNFMKCGMTSRNSVAQWFFTTVEENAVRFPNNRPGQLHD